MHPAKNFSLTARSFALLLFAFSFVFAACGNDKGKVEGINMLYGTSSKVWKTAKEVDATGDKVAQTAADESQSLHIYANNTYTMTGGTASSQGKFTFDQAGKTLTMTPDGATQSNTFTVETLTEKKLTLVGTSGAKMTLEAE